MFIPAGSDRLRQFNRDHLLDNLHNFSTNGRVQPRMYHGIAGTVHFLETEVLIGQLFHKGGAPCRSTLYLAPGGCSESKGLYRS
jgi:hypothetical protein